jgi:hypothetical protein
MARPLFKSSKRILGAPWARGLGEMALLLIGTTLLEHVSVVMQL